MCMYYIEVLQNDHINLHDLHGFGLDPNFFGTNLLGAFGRSSGAALGLSVAPDEAETGFLYGLLENETRPFLGKC